MRNKWILKRMRDIWAQIKGLGLLGLLPLIIFYIVIPIVDSRFYILLGKTEELRINITNINNLVIPISSVIWNVFMLQKYIESPGNELFYVYERNQLFNSIAVTLIYILSVTPLHIVFIKGYSDYYLEFIRVIIVCLFLNAFVYMFMYICKSSIFTSLVCVIYVMGNFITNSNDKRIYRYVYAEHTDLGLLIKVFLPMLGLAVVMYIVGFILNKKFNKYL